MLRKIILSGKLGKTFGKIHHLDVRTPGEAVRALCANFPGFAKHLTESEAQHVAYRVLVDKAPLGEIENLHKPFSQIFRIVPVIAGAKGDGLFGVLLGAALIGASFFLPGAALFTIGTFAPSFASIAFGIGSSLVLGGISSMLSRQPSTPKPTERRPENNPSAYFDGPVNTTAQGQCVPVGYGRCLIGSHVISFGITADDYNASGI